MRANLSGVQRDQPLVLDTADYYAPTCCSFKQSLGSSAMKGYVCSLIIFHFTIGQNVVYDARNCGITRIRNHARSLFGTRYRRSLNDNSTADDDELHKGLNENDVQDDDENEFMQEKVMGGRRAERGELPWAVFLHTRTDACGGTLVSRRHVITAAHCFWKSKEKGMGYCSTSNMYRLKDAIHDTEVFIGGTCSSAGRFGCTKSDIGRKYKVARAFYWSYFMFGCGGTHDIAILELTEDVPKTINHICLPFMHHVEELEDPYLKLWSFGWGVDPLNHAGKCSPYLQIADLGVKLPKETCDRMKRFKAEDTFCTISSKQPVCQGDSGGGLTTRIRGRSYLMGVVSYGPDCNSISAGKIDRQSLLQVHTNIMYHKKIIEAWIRTSSRENNAVLLHKDAWLNLLTSPYYYYRPSQPITGRRRNGANYFKQIY
ncbi:unnamed protein product [Cylicocyclus nassatus]|uniref:Peptidase S1 domain-containing protein n=1 Tax=Cylicocyclus nassatus TaxID=53992 RepID=A0AA36GX46_CYLNA|nr:unnamed protein product [Cylicocyclus nassatus]